MGVLVLKRLTDALRDGDTIRAVVRSTASNQDGRTPGITQPSKTAQEILIRETYEKADLDIGITRYIEAHGTGTAVGLLPQFLVFFLSIVLSKTQTGRRSNRSYCDRKIF